MVNSSQDEESYSRMHSLVIWLPPLVGRRAMYLFSVVIFAFAGGGRCGAVSSRSGTLDGTLFDSADDTTHRAVLFLHVHFDIRVARAPKWVIFCGKTNSRRFPWHRKAFRRIGFALRAFHDGNLHVCAAWLRFFTRQDPTARRSVVILMGAH